MSAPAGLLVRGHSSKPSPRTFDGSRMVLAAALALLGYLGIKWSVTPVCPSSTAPQVGIQGTDFCALPQASPHDLKEGGTPEVDMRALRRFIKKDGQELLTFTDFLLACASVEGCMLPIETPPLSDSEVVYVALTSTVTQYERLPAIISSWAKDLNYFAFSDKEDAALKCYTFPYIEGKPDWDTAQHHQTKGLQWLFEEPQASRHGIHRAKWFVFLDDDTWVNVEALHGTLSRINWRSWLAMGYVWHHIYSDIDHFSGGSGVVVSAPVAKALAEGLYTRKGCEPRIVNGKVWNDVFMSECMRAVGALFVHGDKFKPAARSEFNGDRVDPVKIFDSFTIHKVFGDRHEYYSRIQATHMSGGYPQNFGGLPVDATFMKSFTGGAGV